jgi:hypothetical protein
MPGGPGTDISIEGGERDEHGTSKNRRKPPGTPAPGRNDAVLPVRKRRHTYLVPRSLLSVSNTKEESTRVGLAQGSPRLFVALQVRQSCVWGA